jgi:hypothetical protein
MAVALGFAVLYATFVTLILVPCLYMILEDLKAKFVWFFSLFGKIFKRKGTVPLDRSASEV